MKYKKVVFTKPWEVEIQDSVIDQSEIPANHALVKKHYSLISTGTELACLSGNESWFSLPGTPGYCNVGEIVALGEGVKEFKEGDMVFQYGSHSELEILPVNDIFLKTPLGIETKYLPLTRMATIAMTSIRVSDIELGDYVAVVGQGLVGNMAAQLAKLQGATVTAIDLSDSRLEISKQCGIKHTINSSTCNVKERINEITKSLGVSTLIEATGAPKAVVDSLPLIGKGGEIILLGSPRGEYQHNITELLNYCHLDDFGYITFKGAIEWRYPVLHDSFVKHSLERNTKIVFELIKDERLIIKPLISKIVKPYEVPEAYNDLKNKKGENLGILIDWN